MNQQRELTENEQKKEFLMEYQVAKRDVIRLEEQLEELRINKMSPSSMIGDDMPHAHNMTDLSDYAVKVDELEREIWTARYRRINAFQRVQKAIEEIQDDQEKQVLTYRYIKNLKWEEICVKMSYKWRNIHYLHSRALKNLKIA